MTWVNEARRAGRAFLNLSVGRPLETTPDDTSVAVETLGHPWAHRAALARYLLITTGMRRVLLAIALSSLCSACGGDAACLTVVTPAVSVTVLNRDNERPIEGALVRVGDETLTPVGGGRYESHTFDGTTTFFATHVDYETANGELEPFSNACSSGWSATLLMKRTTPCDDGPVAGIEVRLSDSAGTPVSGAEAVLVDGTYNEALREVGDGWYTGAFDRPGYYQLDVTARGFAPMMQPGVWVAEDDCGVVTERLEVTLEEARG